MSSCILFYLKILYFSERTKNNPRISRESLKNGTIYDIMKATIIKTRSVFVNDAYIASL